MTAKLTIAMATVLAVCATAAVAEDTIGEIKRTAGQVVIERGDAQIAPEPGLLLERGDRLVTGADGYASIHMRHAASLSIGANSAVPLDRYAADDKPVAKRAPRILQGLASFFAVNRQR